jgi:putative flippase GtrA
MIDAIVKHKSKIAYLLVGGWNTFFGYGAFALLYYFLSSKTHSAVILTISYVISITNAFIGYKIFVFRTKGNILREYIRFYVVYGGAFLINLVLLPLCMNHLLLSAYVSQAFITMLTVVASYVFHSVYTFKVKMYMIVFIFYLFIY